MRRAFLGWRPILIRYRPTGLLQTRKPSTSITVTGSWPPPLFLPASATPTSDSARSGTASSCLPLWCQRALSKHRARTTCFCCSHIETPSITVFSCSAIDTSASSTITSSRRNPVLRSQPERYDNALRAAGVPPEEAPFTDELLENIAHSREIGLNAGVFDGVAILLAYLESREGNRA